MQRISSVLFDIGGVLIQLDGVQALSKLLADRHSAEEIQKLWITSPSVMAHETGKMSAEEFAIGVVNDLKLDTSPTEFLAGFENWVSRPFPGAFELLDALPPGLTIAALSNTSAIHWNRIASLGLAEQFDHTLLSHEIGHLKPEIEPFEIALAWLGCPAAEVVFLDDNSDNIATALALGFRAHQVTSANHAREVLFGYELLANLSAAADPHRD
jgi:putative hydrolase of the HAD superfamily